MHVLYIYIYIYIHTYTYTYIYVYVYIPIFDEKRVQKELPGSYKLWKAYLDERVKAAACNNNHN